MWKKISKEVLDKAPEIIPLKKGELQIKYAETLVRIDKAVKYIENNKLYHYEYDDEELFEVIKSNKRELLQILKGDDNEKSL